MISFRLQLPELWDSSQTEQAALGVASQLPEADRIAFVARDPFKTLLVMLASFHRGICFCPLSPRLPISEIGLRARLAKAELFDGKIDWGRKKEGRLEFNLEAVATALFTSGSGGAPRLIEHTLSQHLASAKAVSTVLGLGLETAWELALPLHHIAGIAAVIRTWSAGGRVVLPGSPFTHTSLVPTQLRRRIDTWGSGICLVGGAPIPPDLSGRDFIYTSYGMTEAASTIALNGRVLPGLSVEIIDGEICVSGEMVAGGRVMTGDLGYFEDGLLHVTGRADHQFISGGENIQPEEIEQALVQAGSLEAIVVPVPCEEFGARPFAFVKGEFDPDLLESKLERFKLPAQCEELKYTDVKPNRRSLERRATQLWLGEGAFSRD